MKSQHRLYNIWPQFTTGKVSKFLKFYGNSAANGTISSHFADKCPRSGIWFGDFKKRSFTHIGRSE
jgi:hypothetical protein